MGPKITVDSATLLNKGLEVIETVRLFGLTPDQVETVIHPQSVVHALVEFRDGSVLAQLSEPDMRLPVQYCLTYPDRVPSPVRRLSLHEAGRLDFHRPDPRRFPCLGLAYRALRLGPFAPCVLNAANEVAVAAFLARRIALGAIPRIISSALDKLAGVRAGQRATLQRLRQTEQDASAFAQEMVRRFGRHRKHER
jgi:1-deoxy-D-xylulose-5-phosphate reductoisomerase